MKKIYIYIYIYILSYDHTIILANVSLIWQRQLTLKRPINLNSNVCMAYIYKNCMYCVASDNLSFLPYVCLCNSSQCNCSSQTRLYMYTHLNNVRDDILFNEKSTFYVISFSFSIQHYQDVWK